MINTGKCTNKINCLYDATGTKLSKQTKIYEDIDKTTDYIGNFVYLHTEFPERFKRYFGIKYVLTD